MIGQPQDPPKKKRLPFVFLIIGVIALIFGIPMLIDNIKVSTTADFVIVGAVLLIAAGNFWYFLYYRPRRNRDANNDRPGRINDPSRRS